jgi:hypothetical protein
MKYCLTVFLLTIFSSAYSQLEFYQCPREKRSQYVTNSKISAEHYIVDDTSRLVFWKIDTGKMYVLNLEEEFECGTNGHFRYTTNLHFAVPMDKTSFTFTLKRRFSSG